MIKLPKLTKSERKYVEEIAKFYEKNNKFLYGSFFSGNVYLNSDWSCHAMNFHSATLLDKYCKFFGRNSNTSSNGLWSVSYYGDTLLRSDYEWRKTMLWLFLEATK